MELLSVSALDEFPEVVHVDDEPAPVLAELNRPPMSLGDADTARFPCPIETAALELDSVIAGLFRLVVTLALEPCPADDVRERVLAGVAIHQVEVELRTAVSPPRYAMGVLPCIHL
jgi:hypothetical protein